MTLWIIRDSFQKTVFEEKLEYIEAWNDLVFYYSKMVSDDSLYKKNYLFFSSSTLSPFSKEEILQCLDFVFTLLGTDDFKSAMPNKDADHYFDLFNTLRDSIDRNSHNTFFTFIHTN